MGPFDRSPSGSGEYSGENEKGYAGEDKAPNVETAGNIGMDKEGHVIVDPNAPRALKRNLKGRHMQMIAIGGAIGAGLFVGSGSALSTGGPGPLVICFAIIGVFMLMVMQALAELGVLYPVNGAFFNYAVRFIDPAWGFAVGWDYAISWLTVLPFELTAATITLQFWEASRNINSAVWITIFLVLLVIIQVFGIRGYGEVEFVLSIIKIAAVIGFIIYAIILDTGGVPPRPEHPNPYLGAKYWHDPGAFKNGFLGFCGVFTTASFAYSGTELVGLAAAEAENPLRDVPRAAKQVLWRIAIFYVLSLFLLGLVVPSDAKYLLHASGANTKFSPFVGAFANAGVKVAPSIFNFVILISVLSVANSCTFGSTRTIQALAAHRMAPQKLSYVDKAGRPIWCVLLQLCFGLLAYINEAGAAGQQFFYWLLALAGVANFFIWGSICISHIRFRKAWKYHGRDLDEIPYRAQFGIIGSYIGVFLAVICIMASFYTSVQPMKAITFFQNWLAGPVILVLYLFWKVFSWKWWPIMTPLANIDITTGMRGGIEELRQIANENRQNKTWANLPKRMAQGLF